MGILRGFIGGAAEGAADAGRMQMAGKIARERDEAAFERTRTLDRLRAERNAKSAAEERKYTEGREEVKRGQKLEDTESSRVFQRELKGEDRAIAEAKLKESREYEEGKNSRTREYTEGREEVRSERTQASQKAKDYRKAKTDIEERVSEGDITEEAAVREREALDRTYAYGEHSPEAQQKLQDEIVKQVAKEKLVGQEAEMYEQMKRARPNATHAQVMARLKEFRKEASIVNGSRSTGRGIEAPVTREDIARRAKSGQINR